MASFQVRDPCGYVCIVITYLSIVYADYVVIRWMILHTMSDSLWAPLHVILFNTLILLLIFAHIRAMCSDPGIVPLPQSRMDFSDMHSASSEPLINQEDWTVCTRCETYRPPRAHHCRICQRCVRRMDHHCPWINNCVGELNQRCFIQFLIYVGLLVLYTVFIIITSWLRECSYCSDDVEVKQLRIFHSICLGIESGLFGIFVIFVLHDQLESLVHDETLVEEYQSGHQNSRITFHRFLFGKLCTNPCITKDMSMKPLYSTHTV